VSIKDLACFQHVNWKPNHSDLRKFALTMLIGFAVLGAVVAWHRGGIVAPAFRLWVIGAGLALAAMIPGLGKLAYLTVYVISGMIGFVVSRVLLTGIFFALVTPLAIVLRLTGEDLLRLRKHQGKTRWIAHAARKDRGSYYRQF
jgi:polyferredoxin